MEEIPYILLTENPGIQILVKVKGFDNLRRVMSAFREICFKEKIYSGITHRNGEFSLHVIIEFKEGNEERVKEVKRRLREELSEIPEVTFEIFELEKCGKHYIVTTAPIFTLFGEPLVMIRRSRYLGYLRRIYEVLGHGVLPLLRSVGDEDGEKIVRDHREDFEELIEEWKIPQMVKYLFNALYFLQNIPEYRMRDRGKVIEVEISTSKDWEELIEPLFSYLAGLIRGIFSTLGVSVRENITKEGKISSIRLERHGKVAYIKLKASLS